MDYRDIYREQADAYDRLVAAEDADGLLREALDRVLPHGRVLEVGAGTGRVTRWLVARGDDVVATEAEPAMLAVARQHLERLGGRWTLEVADARALPVQDGTFDAAVAAWVFGHQTRWAVDWRHEIGLAVLELLRAVRPGGVVVIIETLGTGRRTPQAPDALLAAYYEWLEQTHGFERLAMRTDYRFGSHAEAVEAITSFFGPEKAAQVSGAVVHECTGLWWRAKAA